MYVSRAEGVRIRAGVCVCLRFPQRSDESTAHARLQPPHQARALTLSVVAAAAAAATRVAKSVAARRESSLICADTSQHR
jgi:hypothetical protein